MTDRGKIRQHNEDNGGVFQNQANKLAIVADGMGGHRAGDVASDMTVMKLKEFWEETKELRTAEQAENWLKVYIDHVNKIHVFTIQNHQNVKEWEQP